MSHGMFNNAVCSTTRSNVLYKKELSRHLAQALNSFKPLNRYVYNHNVSNDNVKTT